MTPNPKDKKYVGMDFAKTTAWDRIDYYVGKRVFWRGKTWKIIDILPASGSLVIAKWFKGIRILTTEQLEQGESAGYRD